MKLGKDFAFIARLAIAIVRAILQAFEGSNEDTPGDGSEVK